MSKTILRKMKGKTGNTLYQVIIRRGLEKDITINLRHGNQQKANKDRDNIKKLELMHSDADLVLDQRVKRWFDGLDEGVQQRLRDVGLVTWEVKTARTLETLFDQYLTLHRFKPNGKPITEDTKKTWRQAFAYLFDFFGKDFFATSIDEQKAMLYRDWLRTQPPRQAPKTSTAKPKAFDRWRAGQRERIRKETGMDIDQISQSYCSKCLDIVRQVFAFAVEKNMLDSNPFKQVKVEDDPNNDRKFFVTRETIEQILNVKVIDRLDKQVRVIIVMARFLGLRIPSEIGTNLTWENVRFSKDCKEGEAPSIRIWDEKRNCWRKSPLWQEVEEVLLDWKPETARPTDPIFSGYGTGANITRKLERLCYKAKVDLWPRLMQNLRSSCETEFDQRGVRPSQYTRWVGHSTAVSQRNYIQQTEEDDSRIYSRLTQTPDAQVPTATTTTAICN